MRQRVKLRRPGHATVVAYLALFIAVGGASAFAADRLGKNSVGPKQLKKNAVTTAKIKNQAVTAAKIKKGALTGTQIDAATLGMVPSAAHAASATHAATADSAANAAHAASAANADTLDGQHASAFAPAAEVHTPPRFVLNDPEPGDDVSAAENFLTPGSFIVRGTCAEDLEGFPEESGLVEIEAPPGSSVAGVRYEGFPPGSLPISAPNTSLGHVAFATGSDNAFGSGELIVVAPNGQVLKVFASVEVNDPAGDCVFGITAIGP